LIKKITVTWLLCLFVWNAALAGVPSLLLCLHDDFLLHVESGSFESALCDDSRCYDDHADVEMESRETCLIESDCTDLKLQGGVWIPSRMNEVNVIDVPAPLVAAFDFNDLVVSHSVFSFAIQLHQRGPPLSVHWLTDLYIQKTVLRV
jgi:hypothetical protein